ncbi:MAG: GGDEF domain-containing protein, partial [Planctomycetes bacterium]|nr:GGDEF domain-containing protein [Planctomycetota bacterium]
CTSGSAGSGWTAATAKPQDAAALVAAAARLAMFADYPHPDHLDARENLLAEADRAELIAAQKLRRCVQETLDRLGLGSAQNDDGGSSRNGLGDDDLLLPNPTIAPLEEVLLNVLSSRQSSSYRGIVTAMLAAALRYGTFDRVIYAKWVGSKRLVLRSKAESSARRMAVTNITPTSEEAAELRQALVYERPVLLDAEVGNDRGLLAMLATDQLLAVAVNREFETPAFLLFDRATRQLPIQLAGDSSLALTLGQTGSLLKENLLLRRRRERSDQVALTDPLTRLYNRRMAVTTIERELLRSVRSSKPVTVLLCDLDYFKRLNDQFGHLVGDFALRAVADVLRQTVRRSDILCRFGGEEFLIILPETPAEDAAVLATRIFTQIAQRGDELNLPITVSIGLTMSRADDNATTLLERADHALYASKGNGRNRFSIDIESRDENLPEHLGAK